jgi:hypothetical protein
MAEGEVACRLFAPAGAGPAVRLRRLIPVGRDRHPRRVGIRSKCLDAARRDGRCNCRVAGVDLGCHRNRERRRSLDAFGKDDVLCLPRIAPQNRIARGVVAVVSLGGFLRVAWTTVGTGAKVGLASAARCEIDAVSVRSAVGSNRREHGAWEFAHQLGLGPRSGRRWIVVAQRL